MLGVLARPLVQPILSKGAEMLAKSKFASKAADAVLGGVAISAGADALMGGDPAATEPAAEGEIQEAPKSTVQVTRLPNGHIRVSFESNSSEAPSLETALSAFSDGIATQDRESGKSFKVYTLTPREFERLHAEGSL